ncbi:MAG: heavy-metal-associated domain-containing protein [Candidatus Polarisedimenticolia bacterium]
MRTARIAILGILVAVAAGPAPAGAAEETPQPAPAVEKVVLPVRGMTCGACSGIIRDELRKLKGVVTVSADYEKGTATVTFVKEQVTLEQIVAAINKTGFKASLPPAEGAPR